MYASAAARLLGPLLLAVSIANSAMAQELSSGDIDRIKDWSTESGLIGFLKGRLGPMTEQVPLNFSRTSSVVAVARTDAAAESLQELAKGQTIGVLYLGSGSTRLKLPPGAYLVRAIFDEANLNWMVHFLDQNQKMVGSAPAKVQPAQSVEVPIAYVDHSICYHFDSQLVCY